jgi:signal transduction histidine kinase/ActR/RegA family two-component response regulator
MNTTNVAAVVSGVAALVSLGVAVLAARLCTARAWREYRLLAVVALLAGLYCGCDIFCSIPVGDAWVIGAMHVQGAVAALHVAGWVVYAHRHLRAELTWLDRTVIAGTLVIAVAFAVPGLMLTTTMMRIDVPWLDLSYRTPTPTALGGAAYAFESLAVLVPMVRYARAHRRGVPNAFAHAAGLAALFVAAVNDSLVGSGAYSGPGLIPLGFLMSVGAIGVVVTRSFVDDARELERMSGWLEHLVEERTRELVTAQTALLRSAKMAALGQLSAGVGHEINNPAAAASSNLEYLRDALACGELPADTAQCLDDSIESIKRITKIVRQLLDSGRAAAAHRRDRVAVSVERAIQQALGVARHELAARTKVSVEVDEGLFVLGDEGQLVQVLVNLLVNGAQAIPVDRGEGRVEVRAVSNGGRVWIDIVDDGSGMSVETKRRLFEPFFTTKPVGKGTGLGLAVSLGLVRSMGGDLHVESRPGRTRMRVDLPSTPPQSVEQPRQVAPAPQQSLLLVDDDAAVRRALARSLRARFRVQLAAGVDEALSHLAREEFDVVLSDVQMPGGGGQRLYTELASTAPEAARRLIFFSGGGLSEAERRGLVQPVLTKPLVLDDLLVAARSFHARGASSQRSLGRADRTLRAVATRPS